jgi:hypothetical protein
MQPKYHPGPNPPSPWAKRHTHAAEMLSRPKPTLMRPLMYFYSSFSYLAKVLKHLFLVRKRHKYDEKIVSDLKKNNCRNRVRERC